MESGEQEAASASVLDFVWKKNLPIWTTWVLIVWVAMTQLTDFLDPWVTSTALVCFGGIYMSVSQWFSGTRNRIVLFYGAFCGIAFFYCLTVATYESFRIQHEIRKPCAALRAKFANSEGDSPASDAYQALHCRWFADWFPFNI